MNYDNNDDKKDERWNCVLTLNKAMKDKRYGNDDGDGWKADRKAINSSLFGSS